MREPVSTEPWAWLVLNQARDLTGSLDQDRWGSVARSYPPKPKPAKSIAQIRSKEAMAPITSGIAVGFNYASPKLALHTPRCYACNDTTRTRPGASLMAARP